MAKAELNLKEFTQQVIKTETERYFEENKSKHLAEITGRVSYIINEAVMSMGHNVTIIIKHD